jgi:nucleotide-binding universal stress UspA family protein
MTYQTILVQLDDTPACEQRIRTAARMTKRFAGLLQGIYATQSSADMQKDQALLAVTEVARNMSAKERRHRVEARFRQIVEDEGATSTVLAMSGSDVTDEIVVAVRCADLSIVGQPDIDNDRTGFQKRLVENVLLGGGAPLLVVPRGVLTNDTGTNVLIAWDGGREASRAIRDAMPLLTTALQVTVISVVEPHAARDGSRTLDTLRAYLATHRVDARFKRREAVNTDATEHLLSEAANIGADLIVMGGYGHPRLRELVLGGVTRRMLDSMTIPVLISH